MAGYNPLYIKAMETGLVQSRQEFILPDDAYPTLENAYVWRERIKRKQGFELLGRLRRILVNFPTTSPVTLGVTDGSGAFSGNIFTVLIGLGMINSLEIPQIEVGTIAIHVNTDGTFTDQTVPDGTLTNGGAGTGTINYSTGAFTIQTSPVIVGQNVDLLIFYYFPGLPVMGLRSRELNAINNEMLIAFDQIYAYTFSGGWQEFIPGTTWSGNDSDFFWSTNYWVNAGNQKLFWVTNFSSTDPIRYTDGTTWTDFAPTINAAGDILAKCLCILPFRGRLVVFNTFEGANFGASIQQFQRIRWAAIGNPLLADAWRDDIRGKGGFLDIPTAESIISVGFVRDNLVIYCERSTWQLRYTGRSIAPFQIEKVNSELGAESTFSAVQFDTSLVGVGDKGIVECDSYKSDRIDIKIPDLVYSFNNNNNGTKRVHGIRNYQKRLAFWTYPLEENAGTFPDRRLVYNYENDSWAIYTDSLTCFGTYQAQTSKRWIDYAPLVDANTWEAQNSSWVARPALFPEVVGGNQQGFVEILDINTTNDVSLFIQDITGNTTTATVITSPNHNLQDGVIIKIYDIPVGTPFASSLNDHVFQVQLGDALNADEPNKFRLFTYNSSNGSFDNPQLDSPAVYIGGGQISIRDNFSIISKKFNFLDDGQNIQMGFIDILMDDTADGAISLNVYLDYNNDLPVNTLDENQLVDSTSPDTFFNTVVETSRISGLPGSKNWQRIFCPVRGAFITLEWTLSNEQMTNQCQESDVQIDSQILWLRKAGRQLPVGV